MVVWVSSTHGPMQELRLRGVQACVAMFRCKHHACVDQTEGRMGFRPLARFLVSLCLRTWVLRKFVCGCEGACMCIVRGRMRSGIVLRGAKRRLAEAERSFKETGFKRMPSPETWHSEVAYSVLVDRFANGDIKNDRVNMPDVQHMELENGQPMSIATWRRGLSSGHAVIERSGWSCCRIAHGRERLLGFPLFGCSSPSAVTLLVVLPIGVLGTLQGKPCLWWLDHSRSSACLL